MNVWADVRKPLQPDEPPPEMPSVWATPEDQPVQLASPVADVRGPHMELSSDTANRADLNKLANHDQLVHDINKLNDVRWKQEHPWGTPENHPGHLGKLAHVFSTIGNIAGNIVAPNVMARIPGTQLGMQEEAAGLENQIDTEQQHEAENTERQAQSRLQGVQADTAQAKLPYVGPEAQADIDYKEGEAIKAKQPNLAMGHARAVEQAIAAGRDPGQDPLVQQYEDAIQRIQKQPNTPPGTKTVQLEVGGKPHQVLVDERTGATIKDLGESGEKPPQIRVETPHEKFGEKQALLKLYEPAQDSAERFNVMTKNYEDAIKNHDQQAMLSLLANHLGMTMGLQKGARLTKDIINEAQQSRPWLQGLKAKFDTDGVLSGVTLTPEQMRQMVDLGRGRFAEDMVKANNEAAYMGAAGEGPVRTPAKSTINHYMFLAHGDAQRAKQLAAQDGWSVQ